MAEDVDSLEGRFFVGYKEEPGLFAAYVYVAGAGPGK